MSLLFGKSLLVFRLIFITFLFILFLGYFGIPSMENYFQYKTFFVESIRNIESSDLPAITISKRTKETVKIHPTCYNKTDFDVFLKCLRKMTEEFEDALVDVRENFFFGSNKSLKNGYWETSFMTSWYGRIYLMRQPYNLSNTDYMRMSFPEDGRYTVDLHDHNQNIERTEQVKDFQKVSLITEKRKKYVVYLDIEEVILLPSWGCNDKMNYSFVACTKEMRELNLLLDNLTMSSLHNIEKTTGCLRNCKFKRYFNYFEKTYQDPEMIGRGEIWVHVILASPQMTVKTETLIFPLRSLVAEVGGTLGLFLGFSFVMVWDGIESMLKFIKFHFKRS